MMTQRNSATRPMRRRWLVAAGVAAVLAGGVAVALRPSDGGGGAGFPVLAPSSLPAGFELDRSSVVPAAEGRCEKVELHWQGPAQQAAGEAGDRPTAAPYDLGVREYDTACLGEVTLPSDEVFRAGRFEGTILRPYEEIDFSTVYLTVGRTHMVFKSGLPDTELKAALASLAPFDPPA